MEAIFTRMGFAIVEGPEIEDEWHCFDALNMPAEHPARDMQDTLYLATPFKGDSGRPTTCGRCCARIPRRCRSGTCRRTSRPSASSCPGRVYRRDDLDLTHSPMFGADRRAGRRRRHLAGAISRARCSRSCARCSRPTSRVRFRPSFFPYTEPSAEIDISCWQCDGTGCAMCKQTGWIELGGCGMVHPAVFEAVGYDAERYTGFAWGIGIERIAILRHQVSDIRLFFENDLRFLEQFSRLSLADAHLLDSPGLRDFVDVTGVVRARLPTRSALRGFEVASIRARRRSGDGRCRHRLRGHRQSARLPERARLRARDRHALRPAASAAVRVDPAPRCRLRPCRRAIRAACASRSRTPTSARATRPPSPRSRPARRPAWMTSRLQAAGVRPISPIVDITNYVLMELGHPMHAFDLATLGGRELRIRRARLGERITTLDGVAPNARRGHAGHRRSRAAQAVAGVMGGAASEVSSATTRPSRSRAPISSRRRSAGPASGSDSTTEASSRFERGADIERPGRRAAARARAHATQIGAGRAVGPIVDRYPSPRGAEPSCTCARSRWRSCSGSRCPDAEVDADPARARDWRSQPAARRLETSSAPTFRVDLAREVDLIEEVGRHYGFDKLRIDVPADDVAAPPPDPRIQRDQLVRRVLTAAGLSEAVTFGFIERKAAEPFAPAGTASGRARQPAFGEVRRAAAVAACPGLLDAVAHNRRHGRRDVALFEIGARFTSGGGRNAGRRRWHGRALATPSTGPAVARRRLLRHQGRGRRALCGARRHRRRFEPTVDRHSWCAGQAAAVVARRPAVGVIGQLAPGCRRAQARRARTASSSPSWTWTAAAIGDAPMTGVRALAAPSLRRARPLDRRAPTPCLRRSFVAPFTLRRDGRCAARRDRVLRSVPGQGRSGRFGEPVSAAHVSGGRPHADRRRGSASVRQILAALVREHGAIQR